MMSDLERDYLEALRLKILKEEEDRRQAELEKIRVQDENMRRKK